MTTRGCVDIYPGGYNTRWDGCNFESEDFEAKHVDHVVQEDKEREVTGSHIWKVPSFV